jgi:VanZ family protein
LNIAQRSQALKKKYFFVDIFNRNSMTMSSKKYFQFVLNGVALLCFVLMFFGGPDSESPRTFSLAWGLGHLFSFMLWTYLYLQWRGQQPLRRLAGEVLLLALLLGAGTELLQSMIGRSASWQDLANDLLGSLLALVFSPVFHARISRWLIWLIRAPLLALVLWMVSPFVKASIDDLVAWQQMPLLSGFETPLEQGRWAGNSSRRLDHQHVFSGSASLRVELNTTRYSGVSLKHFPADWSPYRQLRFRVFNPEADRFQFYFRIHDRQHEKNGNRYSDRYNTSLVAQPGWTELEIPLAKVAQAPRGRDMDLSKIAGMILFVGKLDQPRTIYIDEVELIP